MLLAEQRQTRESNVTPCFRCLFGACVCFYMSCRLPTGRFAVSEPKNPPIGVSEPHQYMDQLFLSLLNGEMFGQASPNFPFIAGEAKKKKNRECPLAPNADSFETFGNNR